MLTPGRSLSRAAFLGGAAFEGALALLAWGVGSVAGTPAFGRLRFELEPALWGVAGALPLLALFFLFVKWPVGPLRGIRDKLDQVFVPFFKHCTWDELLALALLAGIGEEALFRGVLQAGLEDWTNPTTALVLASLAFGLAHLITPTYAVLAALVGAFLGWIFMETDSLLAPILTHAVYDFVAFLVLVRRPLPEALPEAADDG